MQKRIIIFVILSVALYFGSATVSADQIQEGKRKAKEEEKAMVIYFFSQHCSYCEAMDRTVFADKEISTLLKRDLVYLRVDVEKNAEIARKNGVRGYPTTILLESNGKKIEKIPGYIEKKRFKIILSYLKGKHYRTTGLREFLTTAESR